MRWTYRQPFRYFTVLISKQLCREQLLSNGYYQPFPGVYRKRVMLLKNISGDLTLHVSDPFHVTSIDLLLIDEDFLQPYHPAWSTVSISECELSLAAAFSIPNSLEIIANCSG